MPTKRKRPARRQTQKKPRMKSPPATTRDQAAAYNALAPGVAVLLADAGPFSPFIVLNATDPHRVVVVPLNGGQQRAVHAKTLTHITL